MNDFLEELGREWQRTAAGMGVKIEPPGLDPKLAQELLELARAVAHTQERRFAPLACYLAGVAGERLRSGRAGLSTGELTDFIRTVRTGLER